MWDQLSELEQKKAGLPGGKAPRMTADSPPLLRVSQSGLALPLEL